MSSPAEPINGNLKGNIAEAAVAFHAARLGLQVFRPLLEHGRYDLVLEIGSRLLRAQCKWARRENNVLVIKLESSRHTPAGYIRTRYVDGEIDAVAAYSAELDRCYLLPASMVIGKSAIQLRLAPPKNGQRAALHWATRYELSRAVSDAFRKDERTGEAQVALSGAERPDAREGSIVVGAHEFRNHFGYYMELAERGTHVEVTRRGRSALRLVSADQHNLKTLDAQLPSGQPPRPAPHRHVSLRAGSPMMYPNVPSADDGRDGVPRDAT